MNRTEEPILTDWADGFRAEGTGPSRPVLNLANARRAALSQLRARLRTEPELVTAFWTEIASPDRIANPELTVLYTHLTYAGRTFTLLEFVSGFE